MTAGGGVDPVQLPEQGTGHRQRRRLERERAEQAADARSDQAERLRRIGLVLAMVALTTAVPLLAYIGFHQVLHSTAGRNLDPVNDPA